MSPDPSHQPGFWPFGPALRLTPADAALRLHSPSSHVGFKPFIPHMHVAPEDAVFFLQRGLEMPTHMQRTIKREEQLFTEICITLITPTRINTIPGLAAFAASAKRFHTGHLEVVTPCTKTQIMFSDAPPTLPIGAIAFLQPRMAP